MKKNIYLTVLSIITMICMIAGVANHIGGFPFGAKLIDKKIISIDREDKDTAAADKDTSGSGNESIKDGEVISVDAVMDYADLNIRSGDKLKIEYSGADKYEPRTELKDGILTIRQRIDKKLNIGLKNDKAELNVTLPESVELSELKIKMSAGDIDLRGLSAEQCSTDCDYGETEVESCSLGEAYITSSAGDIEVKRSTFKKLVINEDLGDIGISTGQDMSDARIVLETSLGEVEVNGRESGRSFEQNGTDGTELIVKNDLGDIDLSY